MTKRLLFAAALLTAAGVMTLGAQGPRRAGPGPRPGPGGMGWAGGSPAIDDPAQFLLAHTGELKLTDAQVTRLAAIARRSADRRQALRSQMDSLRPERMAGGRPDSAARAAMRQRFEQLRPQIERLRDQSLADRRDAIAVLTPDQQALAWDRIAATGTMRRGGMGAGFGRGFGRGFGPRRGGLGRPMPGARMRNRPMAPGRMGPPNDDAGAGADRNRPAPRRRPIEDQTEPR